MLRALHIVPREPTPLPLEERPEDELTAEELRQVVRQLKKVNCIITALTQCAEMSRNVKLPLRSRRKPPPSVRDLDRPPWRTMTRARS